jgi:hypothetical protein
LSPLQRIAQKTSKEMHAYKSLCPKMAVSAGTGTLPPLIFPRILLDTLLVQEENLLSQSVYVFWELIGAAFLM